MTQEQIKALAEKEYPESQIETKYSQVTLCRRERAAFTRGAMLAVEENKLVQALKEIESIPEEKISMNRPNIYLEGINEGVEKCKEIASIALSSLELKPPASEPDDEVKRLERVIEIKEAERKEWAELCIRKQAVIESLNMDMFRVQENMLLGNMEASNKIVLAAINNLKNYL